MRSALAPLTAAAFVIATSLAIRIIIRKAQALDFKEIFTIKPVARDQNHAHHSIVRRRLEVRRSKVTRSEGQAGSQQYARALFLAKRFGYLPDSFQTDYNFFVRRRN